MAREDRSFSRETAITVIGVRNQWIQALPPVEILSRPGLAPLSTCDPKRMVGVTIYPILYWRTRCATSGVTRIGMESRIATVTLGLLGIPTDST